MAKLDSIEKLAKLDIQGIEAGDMPEYITLDLEYRDLAKQYGRPTVWARFENETSKQYGAFLIYLRLALMDKSISQAYRDYMTSVGKTPAQATPHHWYEWARANDWEIRARSYEDFLTYVWNQTRVIRLAEMNARHARTGAKMVRVANDALDGIDPDKMEDKDVRGFLDTGAKVERLGAGVVDAHVLVLDHEGQTLRDILGRRQDAPALESGDQGETLQEE